MTELDRALQAIEARKNGVWDDKSLMSFGPSSPSMSDDIQHIQTECLIDYGFMVGPRNPQINRKYPGKFMVAESHEDCELPTDDGSNGPWCVVGDNLNYLINEAFDFLVSSML